MCLRRFFLFKHKCTTMHVTRTRHKSTLAVHCHHCFAVHCSATEISGPCAARRCSSALISATSADSASTLAASPLTSACCCPLLVCGVFPPSASKAWQAGSARVPVHPSSSCGSSQCDCLPQTQQHHSVPSSSSLSSSPEFAHSLSSLQQQRQQCWRVSAQVRPLARQDCQVSQRTAICRTSDTALICSAAGSCQLSADLRTSKQQRAQPTNPSINVLDPSLTLPSQACPGPCAARAGREGRDWGRSAPQRGEWWPPAHLLPVPWTAACEAPRPW